MVDTRPPGLSINIAAYGIEDARVLFEEAIKMVETGESFSGSLIRGPIGVATLDTHY